MTIGTWEPDQPSDGSSFEIEQSQLHDFIDISRRNDFDEIDTLFTPEQLRTERRMMSLPAQQWRKIAEALDDDEITHLIRFFTLAEMKLTGWEAGADSPVVWLAKILRKRGNPPKRDLLVWIKANSTNKFLPYGQLF